VSKKSVMVSVVVVATVAGLTWVAAPVTQALPEAQPFEIGAWEVALELAGSFLFLVAVATAIEVVVTTFRWVVDLLPGESPKTYVLGVLGITFSILFGINVFDALAVSVDFHPANPTMFRWAGLVLTGLLAGCGSEVVHNWLTNLGIVFRSEEVGESRPWP
jgi:hypothetical protein